MRFEMNEHNILIHAPSTTVRNYLQNYMGATYSDAKKYCKLIRTMGVMNELYEKVPELRTDEDFIRAGHELAMERQRTLNKRQVAIKLAKEWPADHPLRPYQCEDVEILTNMTTGGIFNEPRTGKTPTTIMMIKEKETLRNLIVAPASLLWTWYNEIQKWLPQACVFVVEGSKLTPKVLDAFLLDSKIGVQSFLIVSKNSLAAMDLEKIKFDLAVVDEAHFLRNYDSIQSKAVYKIKAAQRFALTGTPTVKGPDDIFGILKFLEPKKFTSYWQFVDRYFMEDINVHTGRKAVGSLRPGRKREMQELVGLMSVSRKRKDVMFWLPDKTYKRIYATMTAKQAKYYKEMKQQFYTEAEEQGWELDAPNLMAQMMRLRQIALDPRTVGNKEVGGKTKQLLQLLSDMDGKPAIIMSMFTGYLNILKQDLEAKKYRVGMIVGEKMTAKQKQAAADAFQRGEIDVLLCNIISAGTGWTLDRGDTIVFMDTAWNPSDNEQAEDRVTPTTKENLHDHNVIHLSVPGTVDDYMFDLLKRKKSLTDIINNGASNVLKELLS